MSEGVKYDAGKPRWDLIPPHALEAMVRVLSFGAKKYAPNNWQRVPGGQWRYTRALLGHVFEWMKSGGVDKDPETGESHLAHAACCLFFLLDFEEQDREFPPDA